MQRAPGVMLGALAIGERMDDLVTEGAARCAACGMPAHRYGRNEGMERFDPMACINTLRGELEREASPDWESIYKAANAVQVDYTSHAVNWKTKVARAAVDTALGIKVDQT